MPWTRQQVKYLLSSGSPLKGDQKEKMKGELHSDPTMGHKHKGSSALSKALSGLSKPGKNAKK
jgi:hypothetical protein